MPGATTSIYNTLAHIAALGHRILYPEEYKFIGLWGNLTFPHRPTESEVGVYRGFVDRGTRSRPQLIIFGATPELRDLAAELGADTTLFDIEPGIFAGMLRFCRRARPEREVWIKGDWLNTSLPERHYDVILGDLILRNVDVAEQEWLLESIRKACAPGGKFITRVHCINPENRKRNWEEIFDEMRHFPYEQKKYEAMSTLLSRLFDKSTKEGRVSPADIAHAAYGYLKTREPSFEYRMFLLEFLEKRIRNMKRLASQTREDIENLLQKYFVIEDSKAAGGYPEAEFYPIYCLRPRA